MRRGLLSNIKLPRIFSRKKTSFVSLGRGPIAEFFARVGLTTEELNHHVQIVGASGYGKSVLLSHLIRDAIHKSRGLLFLDLKSDRETIEDVKRVAAAANRLSDLKFFSLSDLALSSSYNPLKAGTATQLRDRIVQSLNWSEEYYKNVTASFLLKALIALCYLRDHLGKAFGIDDILKLASDPKRLESLCKLIPEAETRIKDIAKEAMDFISVRENQNSLQGLRSQLESLVLSDFGEKLTASAAADAIDLYRAVNESKLVYILLDSRRYSETAKMLARFVLQDLKATSSRIDAEIPKADRKPFQVVIDEFADIATEDFVSFLDRARSSKMSVVIAHQELSDLKRVSPEFQARLTGNMSTCFAFLQKNKESAELISSMAGTREVRKETFAEDGVWFLRGPTGARSVRFVEEFLIHPNVIKSLRVGECVVIKKYPYARSHRIRIHAPK